MLLLQEKNCTGVRENDILPFLICVAGAHCNSGFTICRKLYCACKDIGNNKNVKAQIAPDFYCV